MPKKVKNETQEDQSARFRAQAEHMIAVGELNPTEAESAMDELVRKSRPRKPQA